MRKRGLQLSGVAVNRTFVNGTGNGQRIIGEIRGDGRMHSILIKDTSREERQQIVAESIGNISGLCDGCSAGLAEMYQDYIDGKREIREINMDFRARYQSGATGPEKSACGYSGLQE